MDNIKCQNSNIFKSLHHHSPHAYLQSDNIVQAKKKRMAPICLSEDLVSQSVAVLMHVHTHSVFILPANFLDRLSDALLGNHPSKH